ncbi:MAG: hypothetical protein AMJ46_05555 [Latescibacteria bacterium DG_63]|nr:MAG: hypothetical protein AMJ46_05555 [Latescibacteria bacterium DG_63]
MEMEIVFPGGKMVDAVYKGFTIRTDQRITSGGDGSAPEPFDLFLASIGTCSGLYVVAFCQERGIPLDNAKLILKTEVNRETRMLSKIIIEIQLPPEFPEKYERAVIRAAKLCAVTKHLFEPPVFEIYTTTEQARA